MFLDAALDIEDARIQVPSDAVAAAADDDAGPPVTGRIPEYPQQPSAAPGRH